MGERQTNYVYVIRYEHNLQKVGHSSDPRQRLAHLQYRFRGLLKLVRVWRRTAGDASAVEAIAHQALAPWRSGCRDSRERYRINSAAACAAVDFAVTFVDKKERAPRSWDGYLPPATAEAVKAVDAMPPLVHHSGYIRDGSEEEILSYAQAMRRAGCDPQMIFHDYGPNMNIGLLSALKNLREGDVFHIPTSRHLSGQAMRRVMEKGAAIVEVANG